MSAAGTVLVGRAAGAGGSGAVMRGTWLAAAARAAEAADAAVAAARAAAEDSAEDTAANSLAEAALAVLGVGDGVLLAGGARWA
ncbi:MAG TPA: hypothetical protein VGH01_00270 [Jatrophihabitantaceae bacterium]